MNFLLYLCTILVVEKWKLEKTIDVTPLTSVVAGRTWKLAPLPDRMVWLLNMETRWSEDSKLLYAVRRASEIWMKFKGHDNYKYDNLSTYQ